jgi:hypothetical protein
MGDNQEQTLIEKEIATLYDQTRAGEARGKKVARLRKVIAYGLKAIAGGGSLVVATGYLSHWQQLIGVAILVAIFLDTISSNHKRLLAEAKAGYTYEFLRESVSRKYNRELDPLVKQLRKAGVAATEAEAAHKAVDKLQWTTQKELADGISQIKRNLADSDLKALEALTLDKERAAAQQVES